MCFWGENTLRLLSETWLLSKVLVSLRCQSAGKTARLLLTNNTWFFCSARCFIRTKLGASFCCLAFFPLFSFSLGSGTEVEGEPTRWFLNKYGVMICRQCHNTVHSIASNEVLALQRLGFSGHGPGPGLVNPVGAARETMWVCVMGWFHVGMGWLSQNGGGSIPICSNICFPGDVSSRRIYTEPRMRDLLKWPGLGFFVSSSPTKVSGKKKETKEKKTTDRAGNGGVRGESALPLVQRETHMKATLCGLLSF